MLIELDFVSTYNPDNSKTGAKQTLIALGQWKIIIRISYPRIASLLIELDFISIYNPDNSKTRTKQTFIALGQFKIIIG